jgi:hypothetical protein
MGCKPARSRSRSIRGRRRCHSSVRCASPSRLCPPFVPHSLPVMPCDRRSCTWSGRTSMGFAIARPMPITPTACFETPTSWPATTCCAVARCLSDALSWLHQCTNCARPRRQRLLSAIWVRCGPLSIGVFHMDSQRFPVLPENHLSEQHVETYLEPLFRMKTPCVLLMKLNGSLPDMNSGTPYRSVWCKSLIQLPCACTGRGGAVRLAVVETHPHPKAGRQTPRPLTWLPLEKWEGVRGRVAA